jgi:hypothetical protein
MWRLKTMNTALFPNTLYLTRWAGALSVVALLSGGCASVLPTTVTKSQSQWQSYSDAKLAFDGTVLDQTTNGDLRVLGFTPEGGANVRVLNYVDVVNLFGSAFRLEELPGGVKRCVDAREKCLAYIVKVQNIKAKREGNVPIDLFGFGKRTHTSGWEFQATLVLVDGKLVYKLWNGTPAIDTFEKQTTPLGPMQNLGGAVSGRF